MEIVLTLYFWWTFLLEIFNRTLPLDLRYLYFQPAFPVRWEQTRRFPFYHLEVQNAFRTDFFFSLIATYIEVFVSHNLYTIYALSAYKEILIFILWKIILKTLMYQKNLEKKEALLVVKNKFSHFPHYSNLINGF